MNIEAVRRVTVNLSKADLIQLLKEKCPDLHVQAMATGGSPVAMAATNEGVVLTWFSGPLSKVDTEDQ